MRALVAVCCLTAFGLCGAGTAQTHDVAVDFSTAQNPNGVWSYGWSASRGSTLNLSTATGQELTFGTLVGWLTFPGILSPAYAVTNWNAPGEFIPADTVNLHPGEFGENSVVRWTCPEAGTYTIDGSFTGNNFGSPTTTDVAILSGAAEIFTGQIDSYNAPLVFSLSEQLSAGDTIDFSVGYGSNGNYSGDATGLIATIVLDEAAAIDVTIDVKPGSPTNSINFHSRGNLRVAILTTGTFDAADVDPTTVRFGVTGTEAAAVASALEDVDGDTDLDLVLRFDLDEAGIVCGTTSVSLTGETLSAVSIEGSDSIRTVGCG